MVKGKQDGIVHSSLDSQFASRSSSPSSKLSASNGKRYIGQEGSQRSNKQLSVNTQHSHHQRSPGAPPVVAAAASPPQTMSKLSEGLKALINAPFARPGYIKPPASTLKAVFTRLSKDAASREVGQPAWLTFSTATAMTMNAPDALTQLWSIAQQADAGQSPVATAELQREVGLKCISFNGIPRSINCLGAFYNSLPEDVQGKLRERQPAREFNPVNVEKRQQDGLSLWDSVYHGFERKLLHKLAASHPDLPLHIIQAHYANLLSNPASMNKGAKLIAGDGSTYQPIGRVLTSLVAIACLRAQTGVAPQVVSHIFGLRKAYERGDAYAVGEIEVQGGPWLSTEEGNQWLIEWIDEIVRAIGSAEGEGLDGSTSFAPGLKAKL